jgi:hypothetical protein
VTGANVTITTAHGTLPRKDIVVASNAGSLSAVAGTAAAVPVAPAIPANSIILAEIYVPAGDTTINTSQITDKRVSIVIPSVGGTVLSAYKTADQTKTSDASVANDADMHIAVVANAIYSFDFMFVVTYGAGSPVQTSWTFNGPTSATGWFRGNSSQIAVQTNAADIPASNVLGSTQFDITPNSSGTNLTAGFGVAVVAGTSGNLSFAWAQSSSSGLGNTLKKGSWIRAVRLA